MDIIINLPDIQSIALKGRPTFLMFCVSSNSWQGVKCQLFSIFTLTWGGTDTMECPSPKFLLWERIPSLSHMQRAPGANFVPYDSTVENGNVSDKLVNFPRAKRQCAEIPQRSYKDEVQPGLAEEWPSLKSHQRSGRPLSPRPLLQASLSFLFLCRPLLSSWLMNAPGTATPAPT